jgi:hypothetical protein
MSAGIPVEATIGLPGSTDTRILKTSALPDDSSRAGQFTGTVNKINDGAPGPGDPVLVGNSPKFLPGVSSQASGLNRQQTIL